MYAEYSLYYYYYSKLLIITYFHCQLRKCANLLDLFDFLSSIIHFTDYRIIVSVLSYNLLCKLAAFEIEVFIEPVLFNIVL